MNRIIKIVSVFTLIFSSISIINGSLFVIGIVLENLEIHITFLLGGNLFGFQALITLFTVLFMGLLQSLWILRQLKNRN